MATQVSPGGTTSRTFFDTNILVYADDSKSPAKQQKATDLIEQHFRRRTGVISIQVLQEYFVAVLSKLQLDAGLAKRKIEVYAKLHVAEPTVNHVLGAIDLHRLHGISFWDALIVQSAKQAGCRELLSEDMQHGQVIDGVKIINPFL
jgi:predicted nucleic acid-binding protein